MVQKASSGLVSAQAPDTQPESYRTRNDSGALVGHCALPWFMFKYFEKAQTRGQLASGSYHILRSSSYP